MRASTEALRYIRDRHHARVLTWEGFGGEDYDVLPEIPEGLEVAEGEADGEPPGSRGGMLCDMQTANVVLVVRDALNSENQAKVDREIAASPGQFLRIVDFAWKQVR